jgi:hypothetical protein
MNKSAYTHNTIPDGLLEASTLWSRLWDRLNEVRKRKRAFGGQTVDMRAIQRRLAAEQRRKRGR